MIDTLVDYYSSYNANIHRGVYEIAARATDAFEEARAKVARFVNAAHSSEIIWTRNTTEAINLVSFSWGMANLKPGDAILTTQVEHHSNIVPWQMLAAKTGAELRYPSKPATTERCNSTDLDELLRGTKLVALSHVSNVLGFPIARRWKPSFRARTPHGAARVWSTARSRCRTCPSTIQALDVDFMARSAATRCARRLGSVFSTASARCSKRCRHF